jgi:hypothetical protein
MTRSGRMRRRQPGTNIGATSGLSSRETIRSSWGLRLESGYFFLVWRSWSHPLQREDIFVRVSFSFPFTLSSSPACLTALIWFVGFGMIISARRATARDAAAWARLNNSQIIPQSAPPSDDSRPARAEVHAQRTIEAADSDRGSRLAEAIIAGTVATVLGGLLLYWLVGKT